MVTFKWVFLTPVDPDREYLALATFLPTRPSVTRREVGRRTGEIREQLRGTAGVVGFSLRAKLLRRRFYTLSVWENSEALGAFIDEPPHAETMVALGPHMDGQKFVRWNVRGSALPPRWEDALERLRA